MPQKQRKISTQITSATSGANHPPVGLSLSNASLKFDGTYLFQDLSIDLPQGLCSVLLGPSGVGKSSLLKIIAGIQPFETNGSITLKPDGRANVQITGVEKNNPFNLIAYMAQQDLLLPWLSAIENVILGARLRRERPDIGKANELLRLVGLANSANTLPAKLSGGMRQRVALARTLMENRPIILMDEPFSALDAITRLHLQELAINLLTGRTILMVTHDPLEALRIGHRILIMSGQPATLIETECPAEEIPRNPSDPELLTHNANLIQQLAKLDTSPFAQTKTVPR